MEEAVSVSINESDRQLDNVTVAQEYPFATQDVRIGLITAYTVVFCCCFFGNLMILTVITLHQRMRSTTHFFMANLAVADICVGIFCVYQNLSFYLASEWAFGEFLCKMYHFINGLSYTASILILTVISLERYVVIVHPFWTRRFVTMRRLRLIILVVWLLSAVYNSPRLIVYGTITFPTFSDKVEEEDGSETRLCVLLRAQYNSREYDLFNFIILFSLPMVLMCILYSTIVRRLWAREDGGQPQHRSVSYRSSTSFFSSWVSDSASSRLVVTPTDSNPSQALSEADLLQSNGHALPHVPPPDQSHFLRMDAATTRRILTTRKRVIRLLLAVVVSFLVCNLPFHARKFWQYWSPHYDGSSSRSAFLTIGTTLVLYMNSGINPFLYTILSSTFQRAVKDVLMCRRQQWRTRNRPNASRVSSFNPQTSL